jgi:alcohol dehydrogenase class IV
MSEILNRYNYNFPTSIRFGKGVIQEVGPHLKEMNFQKPLVVSDAGFTQTQVFKDALELMKKSGLDPVVFSDIHKNPVKSDVLKGREAYMSKGADSIVGFGGGASMDVARAIALSIHHHRDLFDYDDALGGDKFVTGEVPYFVTIPTTSGTGSEVGRSTVIADDITHEKKILFSPKLLAKKVFADPELTMGLPAFVTATTGMDALTHNVEAYLSKGFSPLCDGIALEGVRLISQSLEKAVNTPDFESRARMMMASLMGATAFQKGLGIVHSLAHPLSTVMDMHHGLANAIMIPYGMEFNLDACEEKMQQLAFAVNAKEKTGKGFIQWLKEINQKIGIPEKLSSQKVTQEHLPRLSYLAIKDPCHGSNPKLVSQEDFAKLYAKAL